MKKKLISLAVCAAMTTPMMTQAMTASEFVAGMQPKRQENWKGSGKRRMPRQK